MTPDDILAQVGGWHGLLPADATVEQNGQAVPLKELPDIKNAKDLVTLAKNYVESQREIGRRVRLPGKEAKPEELSAFRQRIYDAGIMSAPPARPEDYGVTKPDVLPDGLGWNDELGSRFAQTLHKHGAPSALAKDLLDLYGEAILGAQASLKTSYDEGMTALRKEHGANFDRLREGAKRLTSAVFKTPEEIEFFERMGLGDHPGFLSVIMRLAPLAEQDSSFLKDVERPAGAMASDEIKAELARIMSDKTHPMHEGWVRRDPKVLEHVDSMYRKGYGEAKVDLAGGVTVQGRPQ